MSQTILCETNFQSVGLFDFTKEKTSV